MRTRLLHLLMLFLLLANQAWSMDLSEVCIPDLADSVQLAGAEVPDPGHDGNVNCDHCCHGGAHYVGLLPQTTGTPVQRGARYPSRAFTSDYSNTHRPPTPPPNA